MNRLFVLLVPIFLIIIAGCGGGGGGGSSSSSSTTTTSPAGVVTLTWSAPTTNIDERLLSLDNDLAGYNIYYGTSSGTYTTTINSPGATISYAVPSLTPGTTYYFVVTAYDSSGNESSYSNEVIKTAP